MKLQRGLLRQTVMAWFLHGAFICFPSACVASCTHFLVSGSQFAMTQPIFKRPREAPYKVYPPKFHIFALKGAKISS